MRPLTEMDTIQIEITNQCHNRCSNCTRLCGHHPEPYFMELDYFKNAINSMIGFPNMIGIMGGEPLLHPEFIEICNYASSVFQKEKLGLWTCFPPGQERYRKTIAKTFGHIFLNDQTRDDILHGPVLVASEEIQMPEAKRWELINDCWVQNYWSASINPHGAFFCEVAASLSMLLDDEKPSESWKIESKWWKRVPDDFKKQMEKYCLKCGSAMPLKKRNSTDGKDDISPKMLERLKLVSPKIKQKKYIVHDLKMDKDDRQIATYKDQSYRDDIADRYGMFLTLNSLGFHTPHLKSDWKGK